MIQTTSPTIAAPVPAGTDVTAGPLTLRIDEAIVADGTATVANTNAQNDAPPGGLSYVLARVTATNNGQRPCSIAATDFPVASTDGVLRRCPSIALPDPPLNVALAPGESFTGWTGGLANDVSSAVMLFDPAISAGARYAAIFALTDGATLPVYDPPATDPVDTGTSLDAPAGLGETVRTTVWEVTVNNTIDVQTYHEISDYRVGALGVPGANGWDGFGSAIGLDVTIRNITSAPQFFSWTALELIDTNGEPWDHLLAMTQPHPPISIELLPGATANGWYGIFLQPWATTSIVRLRDSRLTEDFRYITLDGSSGASDPAPDTPDAGTQPSEPLNLLAGDVAEVGGDPLNLRDAPAATGAIVVELDPGTQLAITGEVVEAESYRWYPVEVVETGETGFVAEDFLVPAGE